MSVFEILRISETKDVREIKRAYSKLLAEYSPEKDPEGFQQLRGAYEEALRLAKEPDSSSERPLSTIDDFMEAFEANYKCFEKRIDTDSWRRLLEMDICYNIETSKEISSRVLTFIMSSYNYPSKVWSLFNSYFSWTTKKDMLYDTFPKNFIDFVVYKINNESSFNYEYLTRCGENEQDRFIEEFRKLGNAIDEFDLYTADTSIKAAEKICPDHPGLQLLIGRYQALRGKVQEACDLFSVMIENQKDLDAYFYRAELYFTLGRMAEAYEDYKMILKMKPDFQGVLLPFGKCCICLEKYEEAIEYLEKLSDSAPLRHDIRIILNSAYNYYIDSAIEASKQGRMDAEMKYKLAEAYFKASKIDESLNVLNELMENNEFTSDMYSLLCRVYMAQKNMELAYNTICRAAETFKGDYNINFIKADLLDELGRYEESIMQYDKAIAINDKDSSAYNNKAYVLNKLNRYNEALEFADKAISLEPDAAYSYKNKAAALLGLALYEDCIENCEEALNRYPYLLDAFLIKMRALISIRMYDEALNVYSKANDLGLNDGRLYYEKARALMYLKKYEKAVEFCNEALEADESNADFHYLKGICLYDMDNFDEAIECFDKAIGISSDYGAAYYYKIRSFLNTSKEEQALELLEQAFSLKLQYLDRFFELKGSIMERNERYEEAIAEYKNAIEIDPDFASYYYLAGRAYNEIDKYDEAAGYIGKAIELDSGDPDYYVSMSYTLYNLRKYEECIEHCNRAIEIDPNYVTALQNKAWALYNLSRINEAEEADSAGLKLDGNNRNLLLLKLRILDYKELYQDALIVCDRMLEIDGNDSNALSIKTELLEKINKSKKKGMFKSLFK